MKILTSQANKRTTEETGVSKSLGEKKMMKLENSGKDILSTPRTYSKRQEIHNWIIDDFNKCAIKQINQDFYVPKKKVCSISIANIANLKN